MKKESFAKRLIFLYLPLLVIMVFILFPFYWTFVTSIKPADELTIVSYWPSTVTFDSYKKLFTTTVDFMSALKNSLVVAVGTTLVALISSTLAAYAFSRYNFIGRKPLMSIFLCNNMFPTVLLLIPLYSIMRQLGLLFNPASLILAYTTFTIPFSVWLLLGFLNDLPMSLEEAALVDGCNGAELCEDYSSDSWSLYGCYRSIYFHAVMERIHIRHDVYQCGYTYHSCCLKQPDRPAGRSVGSLDSRWYFNYNPSVYHVLLRSEALVEGLTAGAVKG